MADLEKTLDFLSSALQNADSRRTFARILSRTLRLTLGAITLIFILVLLVLAILLHWWAEKNVSLAFFSYLPPHLWILPLPFLLLPSLLVSRKLALVQLLTAALFVFLFMDWQPLKKPAPPSDTPTLSILSYNRGQSRNQSLRPYKSRVQPDVLVLQSAAHRARRYAVAEGYQDLPYNAEAGEFVILSKFPVTSRKLINLPVGERDHDVAARFEIDFHGTPVAVYNVHLPTPRDVLAYYRRGAFLYGIIGLPGTPWAAKRAANQRFWDHRVELATALAAILREEPLPCIAAGDFNMPDHGMVYHRFAQALNDAHEEAGRGLGYTFPGYTRNPLTLRGPWLRLDYAFSSDAWKTRAFETEKGRASQHRAVAAVFSLTSPSPAAAPSGNP